jgi:hypothetical protein
LAIVSPSTTQEPAPEVRWLSILTSIDGADSKEQLKKIWIDNKEYLDIGIPKGLLQGTRWANQIRAVTLKEYLLTVIEETK